jgi:hypothetical protein
MAPKISSMRWRWVVLCLAAACSDDGGDTVLDHSVWSCQVEGNRPSDEEDACQAGDRFVGGACVAARCDLQADVDDCCPGMFCDAGGSCQVRRSNLQECQTDAACPRGQRCLTRPLVAESKTCGFAPVDASGNCPQGTHAFTGRCLARAPCAAACADAEVCNVDLDQCETPPPRSQGCDQNCGAGAVKVYANPDAMVFEQCCAIECACLPMPALGPGVWGRYSDAALDGAELVVSSYDSTYGDLVLARIAAAGGTVKSIEYIDGFPESGVPVANPAGPRRGLQDPGSDVGQYTSLALDSAGNPHIAYYDVDDRSLRYASFDGSRWQVSVVYAAGEQEDAGRFASLALDRNGKANIAFLGTRVQVGGRFATSPMFARGSHAGWDVVAVEPLPSCEGCDAGKVCVLAGANPTCRAIATDPGCDCACDQTCVESGPGFTCLRTLPDRLFEPCDAACTEGQACVAFGDNGICRDLRDGACGGCGEGEVCVNGDDLLPMCQLALPYVALKGLPRANGLFTSVAIQDNAPTLAYYDRAARHLRGAIANFSVDQPLSGFSTAVVSCGAVDDVDVGQHATLRVSPVGDVWIAFQGRGGETLSVFEGSDVFTGTLLTVDDGIRDTRIDLVGAYASLAFDGAGNPYIAYDNQTWNDLELIYRKDGEWRRAATPILSEGAHGSYAHIVIEGPTAYLTSLLRARDARDEDASRLVVTVVSPLP